MILSLCFDDCFFSIFLRSEKSYVGGLRTLLNEFVTPVFKKKLIKSKHKQKVTSNIPEMLKFHEIFLRELIEATTHDLAARSRVSSLDSNDLIVVNDHNEMNGDDERDDVSFCAVFQRLCNDKFVSMYTKFCEDYRGILAVFAKYGKSRKLTKYLKQKRAERKPLTNHLILPIQRVTRYLLLLQELKKKTPGN